MKEILIKWFIFTALGSLFPIVIKYQYVDTMWQAIGHSELYLISALIAISALLESKLSNETNSGIKYLMLLGLLYIVVVGSVKYAHGITNIPLEESIMIWEAQKSLFLFGMTVLTGLVGIGWGATDV